MYYVVEMVTVNLASKKKQVQLDRLVHKLFHGLRTKVRENYPWMNFSKGFSKLTMLTPDEWARKVFVLGGT